MCFGWFYVVLGCFTMFLVSCFNLCLVVSTDLNVVSGCSNCLLFEIAVIHSTSFLGGVFSGGVRWFFFDVREMSALSAAVLRLAAKAPQQHHCLDIVATRC